jgi:hypothetical protein
MVMEETAVILYVAIAWSGLQFGTLWIMQTSILPLLNSREQQAYIDSCQGIDMHMFHKIALTGGIIFMLVGAYLTIELVETGAEVAAAIATLGMIGVGLISEGTNRPIWRRLEVWNLGNMATNWEQLRRIWSNAHTLRTASAFLALAGAGFTAWLTYVEVGVLDAICVWCVGSAACMAALAVLSVLRLVRSER